MVEYKRYDRSYEDEVKLFIKMFRGVQAVAGSCEIENHISSSVLSAHLHLRMISLISSRDS